MSTTTRRRFLRLGRDLALLSVASPLLSLAGCRRRARRTGPPNIVLFLVDDLGVSDSSADGCTFYETPSFERMIREGMRFTEAYSPSPLCSSSRASILTGRLPHRVGITGAITCVPPCSEIDEPAIATSAPEWQRVVTPSFRTHLPLSEITIAEALRANGYVTAHVGKWHLGGEAHSPSRQGYDSVVVGSYHWSTGSHIAPYGLPGLTDAPEGEVLEDRLTSEAVDFIRRNRGVPFFLSLCHFGVHAPIEGPPDLVEKYTSRANSNDAQRNPDYAALVEACDRSLGKLLDTIDALGLGPDTLVVMTSDNGGLLYESSHGVLRAITSNAGFRGGKAHVYEGGTRVPFVARWRGTVASGVACETPVSGCDLAATFAAVAGLDASRLVEGDGADLSPLLRGSGALGARPLFLHFPHYIPAPRRASTAVDEHPFWAVPASTVRLGNEKLVRLYGEGESAGGARGTDRFELYDLSQDPGETNDLAVERPDRVIALTAMLESHLAESGAIVPRPNPAYRPYFEGFRVAKDASATLSGGVLRVVATGADPQLLSPIVAFDEAVIVTMRARTSVATTFELFYSTVASPTFDPTRKLSANLASSADFTELTFEVPGSTSDVIRRLRVDPGGASSDVELDSVRIVRALDPSSELVSFSFDSATDGSYGGAFTAVEDCTVACSAGALHVGMDGAHPRIASGPVTLFGPLRVRFRVRSSGSGVGTLGYATDDSFAEAGGSGVEIPLIHDDVWRDYSVDLVGPRDAPMTRVVMTLGSAPGFADLAYIRASQISSCGESLVAAWEFRG